MFSRVVRSVAAVIAVAGILAAVASAAGPPPPTSPTGKQVQLVATGLSTPTSFAFGGGQMFASDGTTPGPGVSFKGGVFVIKNGVAARLPGSPPFAFGLAWRNGTLYISAVQQLLAWSGWNGTTFTKHKVLYTASKKFPGFNGLAFGADGRLYVGVDVGSKNDHGPATAPYQYDILSFTAAGKDLKIFAQGIRQPWQFAFPAGSSSPFVSVLGQDEPKKVGDKAQDYVLRVRQGQNYGFPKCNWVQPAACKNYAKPFKFFAPHADVGGLGIIGNRLYISEFGFAAPVHKPKVVSMPLTGGPAQTVLDSSVPVVGLATNAGYVYVGDLTGRVFRVKP
jgi:glucose/arabinose dehydrogenase